MRKEFSKWIANHGTNNPNLVFITGDLGFMALEEVKAAMGQRFINIGVCEQNMISFAAGMAKEGLLPICYSIAPFAVFRPYEQIRLDVAIHRLPVKIVGNGGGYGYGIMGATHHALEDLAALSCLPGFECVIPLCGSDVDQACEYFIKHKGPAYLRLGYGNWPEGMVPLPKFEPVRKLHSSASNKPSLTVAGCGPTLLNALACISEHPDIDLFTISTLPLKNLGDDFYESVKRSSRLLVVEEHAEHGGLASHLSLKLAKAGISYTLFHHFAVGYPTGQYGSQAWHQKESKLDTSSLRSALQEILTKA